MKPGQRNAARIPPSKLIAILLGIAALGLNLPVSGFSIEYGEVEGALPYMYFDGAKNARQDRDNLQVSLSYTF